MNIARPMVHILVGERRRDAECLVVLSILLLAAAVPLELLTAVVVEPIECPIADDESEGDDADGLGHELLYANCSGLLVQAVADLALNVPFGYIQQLPEA